MPELFLVDAKWEGEIELIDNLKKYLKEKKPKSIALFASVQFLNLDNLIKEIEKLGIKVNTTKAKRTNEKTQILGCDIYHDSFKDPVIQESNLILYVGDGLFHPKALLLSQIKEKEFKPVVIFDPVQNKVEEINKKVIEKQLQKYKRNLKLFLNSEKIGILVTIKPGQQYFLAAKKLKEHLEKQGKRSYIFIDDTISINNLENYPFIQAWVNTACPRIGTDDIVNIKQSMINLREAFDPVKALEELEY
ncbi:MAG: diphthamide synthesis protein [Nanoarchaeota archaeon]